MRFYYLLFLFFSFNIANAQSLAKADDLMKNYKYAEAIEELKPHANKGNIQAIRRIAECYRKINDYINAEKFYSVIVVDKNTSKKNYLYYGQILMNNSKYDDATKWLNTYLNTKPNDSVFVKSLIASCTKATESSNTIRKVKFKNLESLNSIAADFCAVDYNGKIIFTSSRQGKTNSFDGQSFARVYAATSNNDSQYVVEPLKGVINSKSFNSGPASINYKNNKIYYTKNNIQYGNAITNKKGDVTLKIFEAKINETDTKDFKELSFNDTEYSCAFPSINKEGDRIYYTSDRAGGYGGKDIYFSTFQNGNWSKPKNAGKTINTSGDERYPFIHDDGTLYFSSNRHQGYGGLDIFKAITNTNGEFIEVQNLCIHFNSSSDDFGFFLDSNYQKGYISSDRTGGIGSDDIYEFTFEDIPFSYQIFGENKIIDSAEITINTTINEIFYSNNFGKFSTYLLPNKHYIITIKKEGFVTFEDKIRTYDLLKPITKKIFLEKDSIISEEENTSDEQ